MDEKSIRNSQKVLLSILIQHANSSLQNSIFALVQRLIINTPDRVDDRKNTVDVIVKISLAFNEENQQRLNQWLCTCSRCNIANIRLGVICIIRELLMTTYIRDSAVHTQESQAVGDGENEEGDVAKSIEDTVLQWANSDKGERREMEIEEKGDNGDDDEKKKMMKKDDDDDEYENDNDNDNDQDKKGTSNTSSRGGVRRQLFIEEEPLVPLFMGIIIGRCNDVVITVRSEAVHVCKNTVHFWNSKKTSHFYL